MNKPEPGTTVEVFRIPNCDLCIDETPALFDCRLKNGSWAYVCQNHWASSSLGQLGTGYGQRLIHVATP